MIEKLEAAKAKSIEPTREAEDNWDNMIDEMNKPTLFPLTNSWWTGANIPGKRVQMLTHIGGIDNYEVQCRDTLDGFKGFDVVY